MQAQRLLARPRVGELRLACADRQGVGLVWRNPLDAKLVFLLRRQVVHPRGSLPFNSIEAGCMDEEATTAQLLGRIDDPKLRLILCHLGGGCSRCATVGGRSIDTTMGFTPLDRIAMCTRSGAVDPGILLYLLRQARRCLRALRLSRP